MTSETFWTGSSYSMYLIGLNDRPHQSLLHDFGAVTKFAIEKFGSFEYYSPGESCDDNSPIGPDDDLSSLELPSIPIEAGHDLPIKSLEVEHYFWCHAPDGTLYVETRAEYWVLQVVFATQELNDSLSQELLLELWDVSHHLNPLCAVAGEEVEIFEVEKEIVLRSVSPFVTSTSPPFEFCILTDVFEQPIASEFQDSKRVSGGILFRRYYLFKDCYKR